MNTPRVICSAGIVLFIVGAGDVAHAGQRRFTYVYEATTAPKGQWEYEQWVTWKTSKESNRHFDRFDFRHEVEYGVTDRFQLALYLSDWRYEENRAEGKHRGDWRDFAVETILNLSNPVTDPIGWALYGEVKIGDELLELEGKIIAQKNLGSLVIAYNATIEAEWEGDRYEEDNGEFQQTFGVSYQFSPKFLAGVELLHEIAIPDWRGAQGKAAVFLGPNFSYRSSSWWATLTPLFQVSDIEDEPDFQLRMLLGFELSG